jgi:prepilin peptidase CpaA
VNVQIEMLFALIFVASVIYAILSDYSALRIPNAVSIVLIAAFVLYWLFGGVKAPLWYHAALALGILVLLFVFFAIGVLGAGDVKFLSVLTLWTGPHHSAFFILTFAILGGLFALMLVILRAVQKPYPTIAEAPVLAKFSRWARNGICPYGIPIGVAALCTAPAIFQIR